MRLKNAVWLNADKTKAVPAGHEEAAFLLAGAGATITKETAQNYKLSENGAEGQKATKGVVEPFAHGVTDATPDGVNTSPDAPQAKGIAFQAAQAKAGNAPVQDEPPTKETAKHPVKRG